MSIVKLVIFLFSIRLLAVWLLFLVFGDSCHLSVFGVVGVVDVVVVVASDVCCTSPFSRIKYIFNVPYFSERPKQGSRWKGWESLTY